MKKQYNLIIFTLSLLMFLCVLFSISCGDDLEKKTPQNIPDTSSASITATPNQQPKPNIQNETPATSTVSQENLTSKKSDRHAYFADKKSKISSSPFQTTIDRIYFKGSCHKGNTPEKRKDAQGISAVVEGSMTYTGDDLLYGADILGSAYLRFTNNHIVEATSLERSPNTGYGRQKNTSGFSRSVRGSDPWTKGESRSFHWESHPLNEIFCETTPDEAAAYIELATTGVKEGQTNHPVALVPLQWDEVIGMALRQQISLVKRIGTEIVKEPADAHYSKLDRILVTLLTGKTIWIKRLSTAQNTALKKGPAAVFPMSSASEEWKASVTEISQAKEFGGYTHKGEDQFLTIVNVQFTYTGMETSSLSKLKTRLENSPGHWVKPINKAMGQLNTDADIQPNETVSGKLVFPRQRFERPFRLEVTTPDKETMYLDVLTYAIGPDRVK